MKKVLLICSVMILASCGHKKSLGDKVYLQLVFNGNGAGYIVAHSNPDCPKLENYTVSSIKDCYVQAVCSKCVKEEDIDKIIKR